MAHNELISSFKKGHVVLIWLFGKCRRAYLVVYERGNLLCFLNNILSH